MKSYSESHYQSKLIYNLFKVKADQNNYTNSYNNNKNNNNDYGVSGRNNDGAESGEFCC